MSTQICLTKSNNLVSCFKVEIWNFSFSRQSFCFSLEFTYSYFETTTKSLLVNFFEQHFNFLNHCIQTAKSSIKQTKQRSWTLFTIGRKKALWLFNRKDYFRGRSSNIFLFSKLKYEIVDVIKFLNNKKYLFRIKDRFIIMLLIIMNKSLST